MPISLESYEYALKCIPKELEAFNTEYKHFNTFINLIFHTHGIVRAFKYNSKLTIHPVQQLNYMSTKTLDIVNIDKLPKAQDAYNCEVITKMQNKITDLYNLLKSYEQFFIMSKEVFFSGNQRVFPARLQQYSGDIHSFLALVKPTKEMLEQADILNTMLCITDAKNLLLGNTA